jgi:hypothetical protein
VPRRASACIANNSVLRARKRALVLKTTDITKPECRTLATCAATTKSAGATPRVPTSKDLWHVTVPDAMR